MDHLLKKKQSKLKSSSAVPAVYLPGLYSARPVIARPRMLWAKMDVSVPGNGEDVVPCETFAETPMRLFSTN